MKCQTLQDALQVRAATVTFPGTILYFHSVLIFHIYKTHIYREYRHTQIIQCGLSLNTMYAKC